MISCVRLLDLVDDDVLGGAGPGKAAMPKLLARVRDAQSPAVIVDLQGVKVATASFVRECLLGVRDAVKPNCLIAVANPSQYVLEDLELLLSTAGKAIAIAEKGEGGAHFRLVGSLDPVLMNCFEALLARGRATAPELASELPGEEVGPTAWNNRLSSLVDHGLALSASTGRRRFYSTFTEYL